MQSAAGCAVIWSLAAFVWADKEENPAPNANRLIDALSTYVSLGATVKLGDFGTIRPGLNCKSQSEAKDVTADSIYRQKLILTPGKRLKDMVKSAGITRISTNGEEIATSGGNNGGSGNGGEEENPLG